MMIQKLFEALHSNFSFPKENEKPKFFWYHQNFNLFRLGDATRGIDIDKGLLVTAAASYLSKPEIRSNRLDWIFLDAIIFAELEAFANHVFTTRAGTGTNWPAIVENRNPVRQCIARFCSCLRLCQRLPTFSVSTGTRPRR